jgi:hypothetical protein
MENNEEGERDQNCQPLVRLLKILELASPLDVIAWRKVDRLANPLGESLQPRIGI